MTDRYASAGVDTVAGDTAVALMRRSVTATHGPQVLAGVGCFAGLWDASALTAFRRPVLATSTDGVGTKIAIARALDRHNTVGQDLVGMVVDDVVVTGAAPLFMTDYIACGRVVPERIAEIVDGIARACSTARTALVGGETAEHPDLMAPDEYDLAGGRPPTGPWRGGGRGRAGGGPLGTRIDELGGPLGQALLEPTLIYAAPLLDLLDGPDGAAVHALAHVTGGGAAANLARVLPPGTAVDLDRGTWSPPPVFRVLAALGGFPLAEAEGTWNLGIGMLSVVDAAAAERVVGALSGGGLQAWVAGEVAPATGEPADGTVSGTKGVSGGSVRLVGVHPG